MGNPVNVFDIANESLSTFLAKAISDGTWADVFTSEKVDSGVPTTPASAILTRAGALWANAFDDYLKASYPLVRGAVQGPASSTDNAVARFDTTTGRLVQNSAVTIDDSGNIATAGTVDGRDVSADGAALTSHLANTSNPHTTTLAQALAAGSTTGSSSITIANSQEIRGQNAGSIAFETTTGVIKTTAMSIGDPGTESDDIVIGGVTFSGQAKVAAFGGATTVSMIVDRHSTTLPAMIIGARSRTDDSTHAIVADNDELLAVIAAGHDGADYATGGRLAFEVDGTPGPGDMPTRFVVAVSANGSESPTERLEIREDGATTISGALTVNSLVTSGLVDGRDVSDDGTALDNHIADTGNNPHETPLSLILDSGNTTGNNTIKLSNSGGAIVGEDGGSLTFAAGTGAITLSTLTVTGKSYSTVRGSTVRGSTNTRIYRWTAEVASSGSDITYTDSAADGGYWTVATAGIYTVTASQEANTPTDIAIKAGAALSNTFDETSIKAAASTPGVGATTMHWTGPLAANDRIWISCAATTDPGGTSANYRTVTVARIH